MSGSNPVMAIKIVATVAEMKKTLAEGKAEIVTTTAAMQKMAAAFQGDKLKQQAMNIVAGVHEIGGAAKLSEAEQARVNATLGKAIEKYRLLGQEAPAAMAALYEATKRVEVPTVSLQQRLQSWSTGLRTVGVGLSAAVTAPILGVAGAAVKLGMDAVESENLVSVSFGNMRTAAEAWSKNLSSQLGLNQYELRQTAGTIFNMTTSMGIARDKAFDMSTGVAKLAADMASFRNIPMEEALLKIRSGLTGEAEPLKALGILVDDATIKTYAYQSGLAKQGAELTQQQKVMARWGAILQQTANDQGDLARTLDSPTNQLRIMRSRLEEAATTLGIQLLPYVTKFISGMTSVVPVVQGAVEWFGKLPEPVKLAGLAVAGLLAAAGPTTFALGSLAGAAANLIPLLRTLGSAQIVGGLGSIVTVMANPAVLAAAAVIGGIGFAIYNFNKNLKDLETSAQNVGKPIAGLTDGTGKAVLTLDQAKVAAAGAAGAITFMGRSVGPAVAPAASGFGALSVQVAAANAELAKLSATQRNQLAAALKSGIFDMKALQEQTGLSEAALKIFQDRMKSGAGVATSAAAATKVLMSVTSGLGPAMQLTGTVIDNVSQSLSTGLGPNMQLVGTVVNELALRDLPKLNASLGATLKSLAGPNAQIAEVTKGFGARFGATLQTALPQNIMAAITGGGSVWKAAGSTLGGFLVSEQGIGGTLKKGLTSVLGSSLGGAMSAMLPGIGALAGPLLEKLFSMGGPSEQELAGRTAAANFEKGVAAGLNAQQRAEAGGRSWAMTVIGVRDAYLAVGRTAAEAEAAVEAMWAAARQGPEAVAAVQAGMQTVMDQATRLRQAAAAFGPSQTELRQLATDAQQTYQFMLQSGVYTADQLAAAFKASQEAQARSLGINTEAQKTNLDALQAGLTELTQKRDQLWSQIAAEAPEDVMGVVEAGQRAQLATLDKQMEDQRVQLAAQAEDAAAALEAALASVQGSVQPIIVPIVYDPQPFPGGGAGLNPIPMANGGFGEVTGPTLFLAGEKGRREQVAFSGADRTFADRGFGGGGSDGTVRAIEQLQRTIETQNSRMPQLIGLAVRDAVVGQRGGRR